MVARQGSSRSDRAAVASQAAEQPKQPHSQARDGGRELGRGLFPRPAAARGPGQRCLAQLGQGGGARSRVWRVGRGAGLGSLPQVAGRGRPPGRRRRHVWRAHGEWRAGPGGLQTRGDRAACLQTSPSRPADPPAWPARVLEAICLPASRRPRLSSGSPLAARRPPPSLRPPACPASLSQRKDSSRDLEAVVQAVFQRYSASLQKILEDVDRCVRGRSTSARESRAVLLRSLSRFAPLAHRHCVPSHNPLPPSQSPGGSRAWRTAPSRWPRW